MINSTRPRSLVFLLMIVSLLYFSSSSSSLARQIDAASAASSTQQRTLIRNAALIITMDPALGSGPLGLIEGGDVLFDQEQILAVGDNLDSQGATVVDARGKIVMPGFVDVHNHLWQSLIRGCGADADLNGWLGGCIFPLFAEQGLLSYEDAYAGVRLSTLDVAATGITTVNDFSHAFSPDFVRGNLQALKESRLRYVFTYFGTSNPQTMDDIRLVKETLIDPDPLATLQVGSHPAFWNQTDLNAMTQLSQELGVKLEVHLLENISQRGDLAIESLQAAGALGPDLLVDHAIHLTDEELALLAANDVRVTHNPLSNMRLASGVMRTPDMHAAGLKIGLGLDGGTNDTSDMFNNMRSAVNLQRVTSLRTDQYPMIADVLRMATLGGAEVLDMEDEIGSLTPGKKADIIILNPSDVNFAPRFNWVNQIVYNAQPVNVEWVFVNGQILKKNGRMVNVNSAKIVEKAEQAAITVRAILQP